jgi:adenylate kinase
MNILLLGPPGAGKGTQGERIAQHFGIPKLATGDVLRAAVREGTAQGARAKGYMDRGELVPDGVILGIMKEALARAGAARGVVLDGVVRTVAQAQGLDCVLGELGRTLDVALIFNVDEDEVVRRISARTVCERCQTPFTGREPGSRCAKCGGTLVRRTDDEPTAVRTRLRAYHEQTAPVVEWYRAASAKGGPTRLVEIDAEGPVDRITQRVLSALES